MEEINTKTPLLKKLDKEVFSRIDKLKGTPSYNNLMDFYGSLEEEQQKLFKAGSILVILVIPLLLIGFLSWQNDSLKKDLNNRVSLVSKANELIGLKSGVKSFSNTIISANPIDGQSMMNSRVSNLLSSSGIELSKVQVSNFISDMISSTILRAEADFAFKGLSTDELVNMFSNLIQREKFRIESLSVTRNSETNLLDGQFHGIHFSNAAHNEDE